MVDIIIVGGGPAGMTAAIYARRAGKSVLLLEREGFGGQLALAPKVENYPGVEPIPGAELAERMTEQMLALDVDTDIGTVCAIEDRGAEKLVRTEEGACYSCRAVIVAVGAEHRRLGLPEEEELIGSGVSYCAVCDGAFYTGRDVAVCGGGDSALQEALYLSDICRSVTLIHRRASFRGDAEKQKRLRSRENVRILTETTVEALQKDENGLRGLTLRSIRDGAETELPVEALFVAIGMESALRGISAPIPCTADNYADIGEGGSTPTAGIFVAGDCRKKAVRQLTTAVSDGANAALNACRYLEN